MCYSDQLMKKGLFYKPHAQAYKAGYEIFLKNFLTGSSQNNRKKSSRLGGTKLKPGWGERNELSFFSLLRGSEREVQNSVHGRLPRGVLSTPLSIDKKSSGR